jgi:hypothetical protein
MKSAMGRALGRYWEKPLIRRTTGVLAILAAVAIQYLLANIPMKVDAATTEGYPERAVNLGEHELVIENPLIKPLPGPGDRASEVRTEAGTLVDGLLLVHEGNANELIDAHFHSATLSEGIQRLLTRLARVKLPSEAGDIHYMTKLAPAGDAKETCRTFIKIYLKAEAGQPIEVKLFQEKEAGYVSFRDLWMQAKGAQLIIDVNTVSPDSNRPDLPGCQKRFKVGEQEMLLPASLPLEILVPAGSKLHLNFTRGIDSQPSVVLGSDFQPFKFVPSPLRARGMRVQRVQPAGTPLLLTPCSFTVWPFHCADEAAPFAFHQLQVASNELRIKVSGEGFVQLNGKYKSTDVLELAKNNPMLTLLVGGLNTLLLAWVRQIWFKKREASPPLDFEDD